MNYWPAETANLSECHTPMLRLIASLAEPGRKTAKAYFDAPGWVMAYTTNVWGWTAPGPSGPWGPFFCGGAWVCQHLWEHYSFTRDREYLSHVYPVMKGATEACMHMLLEDEKGKLITNPSTSPENGFRTDEGVRGWVCAGTAVERQIIWELFHNTALAARILNLDEEFRGEIEAARVRIRPPEIGKAGQLMEWGQDWDLNAPEPGHRHTFSRCTRGDRSRRSARRNWPAPCARAWNCGATKAPAGAKRGRSTAGRGCTMGITPTGWCASN